MANPHRQTIAGGQIAPVYSHTFMVMVQTYDDQLRVRTCSGTIIDPEHEVTPNLVMP
jgi:hypothetical protein